MELLGCTRAELVAHIEAQWEPGMGWGTYGFAGWHCDHVCPLASFDLSDEAQLREAFHWTNLQPLWAEENWRKGSRMPEEVNAA